MFIQFYYDDDDGYMKKTLLDTGKRLLVENVSGEWGFPGRNAAGRILMSVREYAKYDGKVGFRPFVIIGDQELCGLKLPDDYFADFYTIRGLHFEQFELLVKILAFKYRCVLLHFGASELVNLQSGKPKNPVKVCFLFSLVDLFHVLG